MVSQSSTLTRDEKSSIATQSIITHMVRSTFNITGHVCPSCSQAIRTILSQHPLIQLDSISVEILGRVELIHNVQLTPEAIPNIVKSLGYGLSLIESNKIILRPKDHISPGISSNTSGLTGDGFEPSCINLIGTCRSLGKALINQSSYSQLQDPVVDQSMSIDLVVSGLTCGFSASTIETQLLRTDGVISASVALATSRAKVEYDPAQIGARDIIEVIKRFGYGVKFYPEEMLQRIYLASDFGNSRVNFFISLGFSIPTVLVEIVSRAALAFDHPLKMIAVNTFLMEGLTIRNFFNLIFATLALTFLGWPFLRGTYKGLRYAKVLSVDGLISFGILLAYSATVGMFSYDLRFPVIHDSRPSTISAPNSRAYLPTFFLTTVYLGRFIEVHLKGKSFKFLKRLLNLRPATAVVIARSQDAKGRHVVTELEMELELIKVNDIIKVNAGERVPCDGEIVMGTSSIDESILAAESVPTIRGVGEEVIGGSLNLSTMLWVKVRRIRNKSTLVQIAELVQAAQGIRSLLQDKVNIVCSRFPTCHFLFAATVIIGWLLVGAANLIPQAWLLQGYPYPFLAALIGASVLVITGPCSLGLAIPVPVMVGCSLGARHGVLVKGGDTTLRQGSRVDVVVFDKTGTLTRGCPVVTDVKLDTTKGEESWRFDVAIWELLLCVETPSQHPLASAIKNHAQTVLSISNPDLAAQNGPVLSQFSERQGKGVRGLVDFGRNILLPGGLSPASQFHVVLGTHSWLIENDINFKGDFAFGLDHVTSKWSKRGKSVMYIGILPVASGSRGGVVGALAAADALRPESRSIVAELRARNIEVWMLTGDSTAAANECARHLGIDNVIPEVLPHQKADRIRWLQTRVHPLPNKASRHQKQQRYVVAMVGEGTNDALALNQADLGIALGGGHDLAINAADAILLRSKLTDILTLLALSKTTVQTINQNLIGVAMYNLLVLPFAAGLTLPLTGLSLPMPLAGLLLVSSSVAILINSLRPIYQFRPPSISQTSKFTNVQFTGPN